MKFPSIPFSLLTSLIPCSLSCSSPSLGCSLPSLPPLFSSLRPCLVPSLPRPFPYYPLPRPLTSSLPLSLPPNILPRTFPVPSLPACVPPAVQLNVHRVFVYSVGELHCVLCRAQPCMALRQWCVRASSRWAADTFSKRAPTTNPFLTKSKKIRRSTRATNTTQTPSTPVPCRGCRRCLR